MASASVAPATEPAPAAMPATRRRQTPEKPKSTPPPPPPAEGLAQSVSLYLARTVGALSEFEDALLREEGFFARQEHLEAQIDRVREEFERNERARTLFADDEDWLSASFHLLSWQRFCAQKSFPKELRKRAYGLKQLHQKTI